jgi:hypothetical protein
MTSAQPTLSAQELEFLRAAAEYLEHPTFLTKIAGLAGKPAEALLAALPERAQAVIARGTSKSMSSALDWAIRSIPSTTGPATVASDPRSQPSRLSGHLHTALAATTGAVGGFFGLPGMMVELPATTAVMLRSIAQIAAEYGADLHDPRVRLECLSVFSFGAPQIETMESAYLTGRLGMALAVKDAATFVSQHTAREIGDAVTKGTAPVLVRFINKIASRFQIVVTEKVVAQAVPLAGAATGALINAAFSDHFNNVARFHFGIVELEKKYGQAPVQNAYQAARRTRMILPAS